MRVYGESSSGETVELGSGQTVLVALPEADGVEWAVDQSEHFSLLCDSSRDGSEELLRAGFPERIIRACEREGRGETRLLAFEARGEPQAITPLILRRDLGSGLPAHRREQKFTLLRVPM